MLVDAWEALLGHPWPEGSGPGNPVVEYANLMHAVDEAKEIVDTAMVQLSQAADTAAQEHAKAVLDALSSPTGGDDEGDEGDAGDDEGDDALDLARKVELSRLKAAAVEIVDQKHQVRCARFQDQWQEDKGADNRNEGTCQLILIDPWYGMTKLPNAGEIQLLVTAATYYGTKDAIVILFYPWQRPWCFIDAF
jgi:hypothetical protein